MSRLERLIVKAPGSPLVSAVRRSHALWILVLTIVFCSCGDDTTGPELVASIVIVPDSAVMAEGDAVQLDAAVYDERGALLTDRSVSWQSSNETVAGVDSTGRVEGFIPGRATITAQADQVTGEADVTVMPLVPVAHVSAGYFHDCLVTRSGSAYCWGLNFGGQLGNDSIWSTLTPMKVEAPLSFASVGTGYFVTCGLTTGNEAYCWGDGVLLGTGSNTDSPVPARVAGGHKFASLSVGYHHSCAVTDGGLGYCWGWAIDGGLGIGPVDDTTFVLAPAPVVGALSFESVSAGWRHACGVATDARAYCWGRNFYGQVGIDSAGSFDTPIAIGSGISFAAVSAGEWHTCGLNSSGRTYCWGMNRYGQVGSDTVERIFTPTRAAVSLVFKQVSAGYTHSCGVTRDGAAYCWGSNSHGELGEGSSSEISSTPVRVSAALTFEMVSVGFNHSCGVTPLGAAYCWGGLAGVQDYGSSPLRIVVPQ